MYSYKSTCIRAAHRKYIDTRTQGPVTTPPRSRRYTQFTGYCIRNFIYGALSVAAQPRAACSLPPRLPAPRPPPQYLPTTVGGNLELSLVDRLLIWPKGAARERALCPCQRSHLLWAGRKCGSPRPSRTHCAWRPFPTISRTQSAPGHAKLRANVSSSCACKDARVGL